MSVAVEELKVARVIDPRTDANSPKDRIYNCFEGAADVSYQNLSQDGGVSNTSLTFTLNPPSPKVFVNRRLMVSIRFKLTFTGTSAAVGIPLIQAAGLAVRQPVGPPITAGLQFYDAPRAYPLAKAFQTVQFSLGNDRLSQNLGQYWDGMNRYANGVKTQDIWHSVTPTMLDQSQAYSDLDGFARNPLRGYGDNPFQCPRGGFVGAVITRNDATGAPGDVATVELYATEMVDLSPFLFEKGRQDVGFIGVQNQSMTVVLGGKGTGPLSGLAASLWSHSTLGSVLTSAIADVLTAQVKVSYLTPDSVMPIPRSMNYNYNELTFYPTTQGPTVPGGGGTTSIVNITQNNIQLQSIPSRIMFWVGPQAADYSVSSTDCYFAINSINLSFDNRDSLLSNATQEDLYQIAVKNKTNLSWRQFTKDCGSVIALDFGEDIPLRATQAPGLRGTFNLRLTVNATNVSAVSSIPTLYLLVIAEGVLTIHEQSVVRSVGVLSSTDVLNSKNTPGVSYKPTGSVYGGSFWDTLRNIAKSVGRPLLDVGRTLAPVFYPAASAPLEIASRAAQAVGVGLQGGRRISRRQLQKMLQ